MKNSEVELGVVYWAKVGGKRAPVKVENKLTIGKGWNGINLATGYRVLIRSAQRLRERAAECDTTRKNLPAGEAEITQ